MSLRNDLIREHLIRAMLADPGNEPSEQDHPDWVDTRKEVSPFDLHDDPFDDEDDES